MWVTGHVRSTRPLNAGLVAVLARNGVKTAVIKRGDVYDGTIPQLTLGC